MFLFFLPHFFIFSHITGNDSFPKKLTQEDEERYLREFAGGSAEAKNILIERNLRLVAHIVKKYNIKDCED